MSDKIKDVLGQLGEFRPTLYSVEFNEVEQLGSAFIREGYFFTLSDAKDFTDCSGLKKLEEKREKDLEQILSENPHLDAMDILQELAEDESYLIQVKIEQVDGAYKISALFNWEYPYHMPGPGNEIVSMEIVNNEEELEEAMHRVIENLR